MTEKDHAVFSMYTCTKHTAKTQSGEMYDTEAIHWKKPSNVNTTVTYRNRQFFFPDKIATCENLPFHVSSRKV